MMTSRENDLLFLLRNNNSCFEQAKGGNMTNALPRQNLSSHILTSVWPKFSNFILSSQWAVAYL